MASTGKTPNLGLCQWQLSDPFLMEDMNEDNRKVDAAVAAIPYVKLLDVTTVADAAQVELDLSELDLSGYSKLEIVASFISPGATERNSNVYMKINGSGAYQQGVADALELKNYAAFCPVIESSWDSTKSWSTLHAELFGLFAPSEVSRYIGLRALGIGMQYGSRHARQCIGLFTLNGSNARIQTINFVGSDSTVNIGAGAKFAIYGVRA